MESLKSLATCLSRTISSVSYCRTQHRIRRYTRSKYTIARNLLNHNHNRTFSSDTHDGSNRCICHLKNRGMLQVSGQDSSELLQGLMTNDIDQLQDVPVMYSLFLNTQGRVLFDTLVYKDTSSEESYLIECDRNILPKLQKHIKMYRLRKKAEINDVSENLLVWAMIGQDPLDNNTHKPWLTDPRFNSIMRRALTHDDKLGENLKLCQEVDYKIMRYQLGIPEGTEDFPMGEVMPLEANAVFMNGVDFTKGCYLGQELTARTHHTGVIRKRFMPVRLKGTPPPIPFGSSVLNAKGRKAGKMIGHEGEFGIALLRLAMSMKGETLYVQHEGAKTEIVASVPKWWPEVVLH